MIDISFKYRLYYKTEASTWIPCDRTFYSKNCGELFIKSIKLGHTICRDDLQYKIGVDHE